MPETRTLLWANNAVTSLAAVAEVLDTVIEVEDASDIPDPADTSEIVTLVLRDAVNEKFEIVNLVSKSGNLLTVERGAEDTTIYEWPVGQPIRNALTAAFFDRFIDRSRRVLHIKTEPYEFDIPVNTAYNVPLDLTSVVPGDLLLAYFVASVPGSNHELRSTSAVWRKLSIGATGLDEDAYIGARNTAMAVVAGYRFAEVDDSNIPFQITSNSAGVDNAHVAGVIQVYRNVDPNRPFAQRGTSVPDNTFGSRPFPIAPCPDMQPQVDGAMTASFLLGRVLDSVGYGPFSGLQPPHDAVEQVVVENTGAGRIISLAALAIDYSDVYSDNLLPYSVPNLVGDWTTVNASLAQITAVGDHARPINRVTFTNSTTGRHEIYRDIFLEPGQYSFSSIVQEDGTSDVDQGYFTVEGPSGEVGFIGRYFTTVSADLVIGAPDFVHVERLGSAGSEGSYITVIGFTVPVAATYRLRIGGVFGGYAGSLESTTGATGTRRYIIFSTQLSTFRCAPLPHTLFETDGYALTRPNGRTGGLYLGVATKELYSVDEIELNPRFPRGTNPVLLQDPARYPSRVQLSDDRKSIVGTGIDNSYSLAYASAFVDPYTTSEEQLPGARHRFYFEAYMDFIENTSGETLVGFVPGIHALNLDVSGTFAFGNAYRNGFYGYRNDGRIYEAAAWIGTGPSFTTGDVIGAEVDFTDNVMRFYKNGTLIGSQYGVDMLPDHTDVPYVAVIFGSASQNDYRIVTARFRAGELQYLPSGALPYDFWTE